MFRTTSCSSGGQIVSIQHLVKYNLPHAANCILVILDHSLVFRVTIPNALLIKFDLLMMSTTLLETCRGL